MSLICNILGVNFNNLNLNEVTKLILIFLEQDEKKVIFTPNPEFVIEAKNNPDFMKILNSSNINIPDGIGVVIGSKILGNSLKERVAGYDLVQNLFYHLNRTDKKIYFLGSTEEVVTEAKNKMEQKYSDIKIVGARDGFFDSEKEQEIIEEINQLKPDLVLVGLGCPKQENWIMKNKDKLDAKVFIGVGGSFDVMSGKVKRAPKIFIKLNLEWFYRLITQPTRFKRMLKLPLFLIYVIKFRFTKKSTL